MAKQFAESGGVAAQEPCDFGEGRHSLVGGVARQLNSLGVARVPHGNLFNKRRIGMNLDIEANR